MLTNYDIIFLIKPLLETCFLSLQAFKPLWFSAGASCQWFILCSRGGRIKVAVHSPSSVSFTAYLLSQAFYIENQISIIVFVNFCCLFATDLKYFPVKFQRVPFCVCVNYRKYLSALYSWMFCEISKFHWYSYEIFILIFPQKAFIHQAYVAILSDI